MKLLRSKSLSTFLVTFFMLFINHSPVLSQLIWNIQFLPPGFRKQSRVALQLVAQIPTIQVQIPVFHGTQVQL
jgi:hypothetical protein